MTAKRRPSPGNGAGPATVRCAIYTRKSTERGLEQEFNSLDAQRESAEAYIASQKHEGWVCLPERYDDGGFSGGSMERPALQRLLSEIEAGRVDAVVVYKLDRLSRSLLDFSRIMETLDRHRVAFVSVTEAFNTKTSMGRMVLNMLASFAQFEREQISDRTRDKMSAARRRGKWVGGMPILGYDVAPGGGRILVNAAEAEQVRQIFALYLETGSTVETLRDLAHRGFTRKRWVTRGGQERGGEPFDKSRLLYLLKNPVVVGKVSYGGAVYPGEHEAIVDSGTWERVQAVIRRNGATAGGAHRNRNAALLKGVLRCAPCDRAMTHAWSGKNGRRYPYYVCTRAQKEGWATCSTKSVPAAGIERFVVEQLRAIGSDPSLAARVLAEARSATEARSAGLRRELAVVRRGMGRVSGMIQRVLAKPAGKRNGAGSRAGDRLADLQGRLRAAEERARAVEAELTVLDDDRIEEWELAAALEQFAPVWDSLTLAEQARAIELLVERVAYDGAAGRVSLTFRPSGIRALADGRA